MPKRREFSKTRDPLVFHKYPQPGKIEVIATKPLSSQGDLALAYSPGVGETCKAIAENPDEVFDYTIKSNLVAVITNGTAVLGFGDIGPLAAKPVMEGKAVLFKKFAGIDVFDIEINEKDPEKLVDIIASLEPTFGGINLEDIKAPECFFIEKKLKERMSIPVFHDDQHGTAIIVASGLINALKLVNKKIEDIKLVTSGAGAAAIACLDLLLALGLKKENVVISDQYGVVYKGREKVDESKEIYSTDKLFKKLSEALIGADVFLGLSAGGLVTSEMITPMADKPIIFALANPLPEIMPEEVLKVRTDAIIATGRSDYPNQINNVLCFPFLFRGALDTRAKEINTEMKIACVKALADLVLEESSDIAMAAYGGEPLVFGSNYIIPKPFDPRLLVRVASAVAKAAIDSGSAQKRIESFSDYENQLQSFVYRSGIVMRPIFDQASVAPKKVVFLQGEDERVLRAAHQGLEEGFLRSTLIGDPEKIKEIAEKLNFKIDQSILILKAEEDRYNQAINLINRKEVDQIIAGPRGSFNEHNELLSSLTHNDKLSSVTMLILQKGVYFITGTHTPSISSIKDLMDLSKKAVDFVEHLGYEPKIALLSHSHYGSIDDDSSRKMRELTLKLREAYPQLEIDGEMHADAAVSESIASKTAFYSPLKGQANLLIMPSQEAAHISQSLLKTLSDGISVGPFLLGNNVKYQILSSSVTTRGILNLTALTALMIGKNSH